MKALVVTPYYHPKIGGLENYAKQLNTALHTINQWDIVVVTANHKGSQTNKESVDGIPVYRLGTWFKFSNTPINLLWPLKIRTIIHHERPDIVIAHTPVPAMADAAALVCGRTPFILFYHASTLRKQDSVFTNTVIALYTLYQRVTLSKADRIVAAASYVKQQFPEHIAAKTDVISNSVWRHEIVSREQPGGADFLFVGSLDKSHAWKGLQYIIEAMAIYKRQYGDDFTLTVMGDGNYRTQYESAVTAHGLNHQVHFVGWLQGAAKEKAFSEATALICYPTSANDAFPTAIIEAWARSVPVVAAANGPITSIMQDNKTGMLVEPSNASALANGLHRMVSVQPRHRQRIAQTAAALERESFTWERQATVMADIAERLV